jgi:hypothetical protein
MTDSNSSLNEVPALLDERRRYEGWLAALDARRESTPKHVFDRVQTDYRARLQRVAEELASHRSAIESERANVQSRLSLLSAEEQLHRDERAELELRTHVGELVGEEADRAFGSVGEAIARVVGEKDGLAARVAELQALLDDEARAVPEPVVEEPAHASTAKASVAEIVPAAETVPIQVSAEAPARPATVSEIAKPVAEHTAPDVTRKDEPVAPAPAPKRESFDELAFLSSIVGKPGDGGKPASAPEDQLVERRSSEPLLSATVGVAQEERPGDSLLAGLEHAKPAAGERPLAANVSANMPIVLRTSAVTEQVKTLKCNECGAMNYPTEWYCERCGAELAAL